MTQRGDRRRTGTEPLDRLFDALSRAPRRRVLDALRDRPFAHETQLVGGSGTDGRGSDRDAEDVLLELRHVHLPRLDDADLIDWDGDSGEIRRGARFAEVRPALDLVEDLRTGPPVE